MKHLSYIFYAAVLLGGCSKEAPAPGDEPQTQQEICFQTYLEEGGDIRPVTPSASRSLSGDPLSAGYRISCMLSNVDYPASATYQRLMWNVAANKDGSYQSSSEPKYFWAAGDATLRHTFVAYSAAPSGATGGPTTSSLTGGTTSQPLLSLTYTNADDPAKQIDFLYSDNSKNIKPSGNVSKVALVFRHRLARVMCNLIGTNGVTLTSCQAKIAYKASTVKKTGTVFLADNGTVTLSSIYHSGTYNLGSSFTLPGSASTAATAVEMGDLILLPGQSLADGWATLTFTYTPDGATAAQTLSIDLPATNLTSTAGQQYNILLAVSVESSALSVAGVTLTDWNTKSGDIDLEGPMPSVGDYYYSDGTFSTALKSDKTATGMIFYVNPANYKKYKVMALEESASLRWVASTSYIVGSARSSTDGKANAAAYKAYYETNKGGKVTQSTFADAFPAAGYCYNYTGRAGKDAVGTWYVPAKDELQYLWCAYNGKAPVTWYEGTSSSAPINKTAQASWSARIQAVGGVTNIADSNFWTSTETSYGGSAWYLSFHFASAGSSNKGGTAYVRCIRDI